LNGRGKAELNQQVNIEEMSESEPAEEVTKREDVRQNHPVQRGCKEYTGYLITGCTPTVMQAA
jgi:hypothetical protein